MKCVNKMDTGRKAHDASNSYKLETVFKECGTEMEKIKDGIQVKDSGRNRYDEYYEDINEYTLYQCPSCKSIKLD